MLSKKKRLNRTDFNRFFASGRRLNTKHFQLIYTPHSAFHGAVVVGKKVYKQAVRRNRLRRQIYAVLYTEHIQHELLGVHIIIARPSAGALGQKEVPNEIRSLLSLVR